MSTSEPPQEPSTPPAGATDATSAAAPAGPRKWRGSPLPEGHRMRVRLPPYPAEAAPFVVGDPSDTTPVEPRTIFGDDRPLVLDLGAARAHYAVRLAERHTDLGIVALEARRERIVAGIKKVIRGGIRNVRFVEGFAEDVLSRRFPPRTFLAVFLICPDPWPKRRHGRRRLVRPETFPIICRAIRPGGALFFKTDVPGYAAELARVAATSDLTPIETWEAGGRSFDPEIRSQYEEMHEAKGLSIIRRAYRVSP